MKKHNFDGTDQKMVFQLLIQYVTEANKMNMAKLQAFLALKTY